LKNRVLLPPLRTVVPPISETRPVVYCAVEIVNVPPNVLVKPTVPVCALWRLRLAPLLMWNNPSLAPCAMIGILIVLLPPVTSTP
jgi:hypothetical protein